MSDTAYIYKASLFKPVIPCRVGSGPSPLSTATIKYNFLVLAWFVEPMELMELVCGSAHTFNESR
jgi:hypothetical protein